MTVMRTFNYNKLIGDDDMMMMTSTILIKDEHDARITSHTATCTDNIFSNSSIQNNQSVNGILFTYISDH